jgi:hypothetical protein
MWGEIKSVDLSKTKMKVKGQSFLKAKESKITGKDE